MKTIYKNFALLILVFASISLVTSCTKDEAPNNGIPRIKYVRITSPESADSLVVRANQGSLIAIIGDNLENTTQVWFNDQQAVLTSTYISNSSILVSVPSEIPQVVNNKLKLYFSNGDSLLYDFEVEISEPVVSGMTSEFVNEGDIATINGDYFYEPLSVTFAGGVAGVLESVTDKIIKVRVPAGVQPGQVTVKTNFGETKSDFWFRDNRNVFLDSDPYEGWWNESYVVKPANVGTGDPVAISGNYLRFKKVIGSWSWNELAGGAASAMPVHSKRVPDEAILKPSDYNLKFEINTTKPYTSNLLKINVALSAEDNDAYQWKPPYDSKGQWQTVIIPFEEVVASYKVKPVINPNGYWTRLLFHGNGELDADISLDNFRIVPKFIKK